MSDKTKIGDRMKGYENANKVFLTRRLPVIVRVDGKSFHTFTKGFESPYDINLMDVMDKVTLRMCKEIPGVKVGYTQSDEISFLLTDYDQLKTEPWFGKSLQKMASVTASMATLFFNQEFNKIALFDSRVFILPHAEVCNYFIWRQQDATRNAIQSCGQKYIGKNRLHKVNCGQIQELLFQNHGINFNDYSVRFKRGGCSIKTPGGSWIFDELIPIFTTPEGREYIDKWVFIKEEENGE